MKYKPVRDRCYQNEKCQDHRKFSEGNIIRHSMYKTRQGRRRRYLCNTCEKTFCSTTGRFRLGVLCSRISAHFQLNPFKQRKGVRVDWQLATTTVSAVDGLTSQEPNHYAEEHFKRMELDLV